MRIQHNNDKVVLWWGSALLTSSFHIYLLWLLSTTFIPMINTDDSPVSMMIALSTEPEFAPIWEQKSAVGITQDFNEPVVEQSESQPESADDFIILPEQPVASLVVEKQVEAIKKNPAKTKRLRSKVKEQRQPTTEPTADNHNKPTPAAVATSTPLSGESHQVAAAANSDSSHIQQTKVSWKGLVQGHLNNFKRYPPSARKKRQQGTTTIRFVVNQDGYVLSVHLTNSSRVMDLDNEALAVIKRAQPLPKPPAELLSHGQITLTLPIGFNLKK